MSLNTYIRSGPYKGLQAFIVSKKPVPDNPYLYRVSLPDHKTILIDRANLSTQSMFQVTPFSTSMLPKESKKPKSIPEAPETHGCCAVGLCNKCGPRTPNTDGTCCCPSFIRCRIHDQYQFKNPLPRTTSKVVALPIGAPELFRTSRRGLSKKNRRMKVIVQEEKYDFEDAETPTALEEGENEFSDYEEPEEAKEDRYCRIVLETVAPEELMTPAKTLRKKGGRVKGVRTVYGNIYPENQFPTGPPSQTLKPRFGGMEDEYQRNVSAYMRIVESRK